MLTPTTGVGAKLGRMAAPKGSRLNQYLMGNKEEFKQIPTQTPQGMDVLSQLLQQGKQNTDFGGIENMYMKKFKEDVLPSIADRYASVGDERASSSFKGAQEGAGSDLMAQLAALRGQYGLQQTKLGLTPQFGTYHQPASYGLLGQMLPVAARAALAYGTGGFSEGGFAGDMQNSPLAQLLGLGGQGGGMSPYQKTMDLSGFQDWDEMQQLKQQSSPESSKYVDFFDTNKKAATNQGIPQGYATQHYKPGAMSMLSGPTLQQGPMNAPGIMSGNYNPEASRFSQVYPGMAPIYNFIANALSQLGQGMGQSRGAYNRFQNSPYNAGF